MRTTDYFYDHFMMFLCCFWFLWRLKSLVPIYYNCKENNKLYIIQDVSFGVPQKKESEKETSIP